MEMIERLAVRPGAFAWDMVVLRLLAACMFGGLIGVEREWRARPAGLRTHVMVAVGACLFCLLTFEIMVESRAAGDPATVRTDPLRVIEAVTAGVAFLAAGTILGRGSNVQGLTTGAGLWVAGAIGVACGIGQLMLAGLATLIVLVVLVALRWIEDHALKTKRPDRS